MSTDFDHGELAKTLETLYLGVNASDLHGSLTGCLCAGACMGVEDWLDALQLDFDDPGVTRYEVLQRLYRSCRSQVEDSPVHITPLLPARTAPMPQRADALVEWCRGFLGGFGLGGATQRARLSSDASGILHDLGVIAASHFDYADNTEDEQALADVIDFVRTGCAFLRREISAAARAPARALH